ncbi:ABC transporter substrate-binding protein [Paenibacillus doosanensis]|uniref:Cyclodextrin-binding protein n=1 Tax=Paenibacillus konkukensis TaxID=2020716 RepID=A0ABY4RJU6_9BACL|nr:MULTISPECIES: ABC transporter substrate-binding protein [Paenibacillus]MCS7462903.1 ABC transporter substrate-binding protein [Paenibacillus doosanensis]UQZ82403.1 Cyclodextrin-binding protein precursor [Paenibacillus konkukensis]
MSNVKKSYAAAVAAMLLGTSLAGCSGANSSSGGAGAGGADKPVELTFWDAAWNTNTPAIVKKFEEKYPNIKIKVQQFPDNGMSDKYLLALKQKNGPDLMNMAVDWVTPFAATGGLAALDDHIKKDQVDLNDFYDGAVSVTKVNDKMYALPYRAETHGLIFNKKLFEAAGLDSSKGPENWNQVLDMAQKLTKGDAYGIALPGTNVGNVTTQLFNMIQSNGGSILNKDNTKSALTEPAAMEMVKLYVELFTKYKVVPNSMLQNDGVANRNLFTNDKVGMYMTGIYDLDPIKQANANAQMGVTMVPANKDRKTILGGWAVGIPAASKNQEAAWKFIQFITQPDISAEYSVTFSARKSAASNPKYQDPLVKPLLDALTYAQPLPQIPQWNQIKQIVFDQLQTALGGKATPEEAMNQASKAIDELLANK